MKVDNAFWQKMNEIVQFVANDDMRSLVGDKAYTEMCEALGDFYEAAARAAGGIIEEDRA